MQAAQPITPLTGQASPLNYTSYLHLDELLLQQVPRSGCHDEALFIVIHQASELWLKLCLHELSAARACIASGDIRPAFKMFARVAAIQKQLIHSWDVLSTMTPTDYMAFRGSLGSSSGFQSLQYRLVEFMLGNKGAAHVERFREDPVAHAKLQQALVAPSLYDETLRFMKQRGLQIPEANIERNFSTPHVASPAIEAAWLTVYREPERYWDLYELAEKLVDLEDRFQLWRYAHLRAVQRIIGRKPGTGGTPGVPYLAKVVEQTFFPELFSVRTVL